MSSPCLPTCLPGETAARALTVACVTGAFSIHSAGSRLAVYRAAINEAARAKWKGGPSAGPIKIGITFYFLPPKKPRHKVFPITRRVGDIDKLERAVLDALTNVVYIDDSQVVKVEKVKAYFRTPQVLIDVEEID